MRCPHCGTHTARTPTPARDGTPVLTCLNCRRTTAARDWKEPLR